MNRLARFFVSLALILAAPGLAPYQAAAQSFSASRVVVPVSPIGAAGASINSLGGANAVLPSASLLPGLAPSLTPLTAPAPVISPEGRLLTVPLHALPAANGPVALSVVPATAKAAAVPVIGALRAGSNAVAASAQVSADAPRVALDGLFEGSLARPEALAVSALSAPSDAPRLGASQPAKGPRWVTPFRASDAAPKTSVKRTLSVGFLAAVIPIAFTMITVIAAQLLGHELHPNYKGPEGTDTTTVLQALGIWIGAAVMAPISEEAIFRGGLQAGLAKLSAKIRLGSFILPAVITSLIFVALHETSDPVLFTTRFAHAMVLSYVFQKEGILAAMAAHGFFNGLLAISIVLAAAGMPWLGLAVLPLALLFALKSARFLRGQKPDMASGNLAPKPMTAAMAVAFAAILGVGYLFLMPNIFWAVGAVALIIAAIRISSKK